MNHVVRPTAFEKGWRWSGISSNTDNAGGARRDGREHTRGNARGRGDGAQSRVLRDLDL